MKPHLNRIADENPLLDSKQATACLVLWHSGLFDTLDIASVLDVPEPVVCRLLQWARDLDAHGRHRGAV